jgi:hypothetical protein
VTLSVRAPWEIIASTIKTSANARTSTPTLTRNRMRFSETQRNGPEADSKGMPCWPPKFVEGMLNEAPPTKKPKNHRNLLRQVILKASERRSP